MILHASLAALASGGPDLVHYLPIGTTVLSAAFVTVLLLRASKRDWPAHLMWWAVGVFFYGVGTAIESTVTLRGNSELLFRSWYWAGAILGAYPLATGSVYLLASRRWAHGLTAASMVVVIVASVAVWLSPVDVENLQRYRPSGDVLGWQWVRALTPIINLYAVVFLIGGAIWSSVKFFTSGNNPRRAVGTALIAFGAMLPGFGGTAAKFDMVELLYVGEFVGLILIWIGYAVCLRAPKPRPAEPEPQVVPAGAS